MCLETNKNNLQFLIANRTQTAFYLQTEFSSGEKKQKNAENR